MSMYGDCKHRSRYPKNYQTTLGHAPLPTFNRRDAIMNNHTTRRDTLKILAAGMAATFVPVLISDEWQFNASASIIGGVWGIRRDKS